MFGLERGHFSVIGYGFMNRYAVRDDVRESGRTFVGAGAAWTPLDEPEGPLLSIQLGISRESASREDLAGVLQATTGGWALHLHPTLVYGPNQHVLLFVSPSLPLKSGWRDVSERERFRVGVGTIVTFGN
jgi:hypothetical protein